MPIFKQSTPPPSLSLILNTLTKMRNESNNKLQQINTSVSSINNKLIVGAPITWTLDSQIHCAKDCKSENVIAGKDDITFKSFAKDISNITYDTYDDGYTTLPPYSIMFQSATNPAIRYEVKATDTKRISIETKKVGNTVGF